MKKGIAQKLLVLVLGLTAGCSQSLPVNNFTPQTKFNANSVTKVQGDWYSSLSPELKSYYAPAQGKTGEELFLTLHSIISAKTDVSSYGDSKGYMYATADNFSLNGKTGLMDAYSGVFVPGKGSNGDSYKEIGDENKDGSAGDFINCEHTWPQSFFNKAMPMVADIHHLQSTLSVPNNRRSSFPFGMVTGSVAYTTSGGSKLGSPGTSRVDLSSLLTPIVPSRKDDDMEIMSGADAVFEPGNAFKGNTARAMLYFYVRYYDQNIRQGGFSKDRFWVSKVATFINWSEKVDPVNAAELNRHEAVFQKQKNRNPFIDIPNLGSIIGENVLKSK